VVDQIVAQGHLYFQAANALGIVHHDIRPENIMLIATDSINGPVVNLKVSFHHSADGRPAPPQPKRSSSSHPLTPAPTLADD
jgi:hypothetical protein